VDERLVSLLMPASLAAEQYRALRDLVEQAKQARQLSIVGVSSALVRDGKTTTALNLAGALAQAPAARVLVVEADLRRPSIRDYLGVDDVMGPGLVGLLGNPGLGLDDVVRPCSPFNFDILVAGAPPAAAYELLKSPRLAEMLTAARRRYDYVVVDTPPILPAPDCRVIGRCVDGFLMVVAAHRTPRKMVAEALAAIEDGKLLGIVFNGDDRTAARYYAPHETSADDRRPPWWNRLRADGPGAAERAPRGTRVR
jgi:capsular exopolysaccharide synthesis family protein